MFGRHSQASQLRTYSKEPEGPPEVPLVEAQPDEGQEIRAKLDMHVHQCSRCVSKKGQFHLPTLHAAVAVA